MKGLRRHLLQEACNEEAIRLHKQIFYTMEAAGASYTLPPFSGHHAREGELSYQCHCGMAFRTPQGLATHQRKKHQEFSQEHDLVQGADAHTASSSYGAPNASINISVTSRDAVV